MPDKWMQKEGMNVHVFPKKLLLQKDENNVVLIELMKFVNDRRK
jgi:hypothetical protein